MFTIPKAAKRLRGTVSVTIRASSFRTQAVVGVVAEAAGRDPMDVSASVATGS